MRTIYKYELPAESDPFIYLPRGYSVLSVGVQSDSLVIWAEVDTDVKLKEFVGFRVRGTGHELDGNEGRFIGTTFMHGGAIVLHVFESL